MRRYRNDVVGEGDCTCERVDPAPPFVMVTLRPDEVKPFVSGGTLVSEVVQGKHRRRRGVENGKRSGGVPVIEMHDVRRRMTHKCCDGGAKPHETVGVVEPTVSIWLKIRMAFRQPWSIDKCDLPGLGVFDLLCGCRPSPQRDVKFDGFNDSFIAWGVVGQHDININSASA